jgi:hypothetical protein
MSQELEFLWTSNVVLGLCGLKILRRRKKANGLKIKRSKRSDPLETSSLSLMKNSRFVWSEDFEKKKEGQWAQEKEIKAI